MLWSVLLEEGRGGFTNPYEYRQTMTDLFFRGITPDEKPETGAARAKGSPPRSPSKSKIDELRELHEQIAARKRPTEVASPPSA
jgi:hypothetical protein